MSEIKGQLLGIIMVLAIFGVVLATLSIAFSNSASTIGSRVESIANEGQPAPAAAGAPAGRVHKAYTLHY